MRERYYFYEPFVFYGSEPGEDLALNLPLKVRGTKGVIRAAWHLAVTPSYPKREEFWRAGLTLPLQKYP